MKLKMPSKELVMVRGILAGLPEDYRTRIEVAATKLRAVIAEDEECGVMALALVSAEVSNEG